MMTNRQEVAKKLRAKYHERHSDGWLEAQDLNFQALNENEDLISCLPKGDMFKVLADLIDPTCEVVEMPDNEEFMVRVVSGFMCKKCKHEVIVERNCGGLAEPPNYCPHCGARVVQD